MEAGKFYPLWHLFPAISLAKGLGEKSTEKKKVTKGWTSLAASVICAVTDI